MGFNADWRSEFLAIMKTLYTVCYTDSLLDRIFVFEKKDSKSIRYI